MNIDELFKEVEELILKILEKFYSQYFEEYFTPLVEFSKTDCIKEDNISKQNITFNGKKKNYKGE